jgi:hypothetical protein
MSAFRIATPKERVPTAVRTSWKPGATLNEAFSVFLNPLATNQS